MILIFYLFCKASSNTDYQLKHDFSTNSIKQFIFSHSYSVNTFYGSVNSFNEIPVFARLLITTYLL